MAQPSFDSFLLFNVLFNDADRGSWSNDLGEKVVAVAYGTVLEVTDGVGQAQSDISSLSDVESGIDNA